MVTAAVAPAPTDGVGPTAGSTDVSRSEPGGADGRFDAALAAAAVQEAGTVPTSEDRDGTAGHGDATAGDAEVAAQPGRPRPAELPTLTLGAMVAAIVDGPPPEALQPAVGEQVADRAAAERAGGEPVAGHSEVEVAGADPAALAAAEGASGELVAAGAEVLAAGEAYLGVPYRWGGSDAQVGFDCSGLVQQVFADVGIELPRVSADQARVGTEVTGGLDAAVPGDLVYWDGDGGRPNHIGIYAGEGRMLVAPSSGDVVRYQRIEQAPDAVRRVLPDR